MTIQTINIGSLANDGSGDPLRVAFGKVNNNFAELYNAAVLTTSVSSTGNTANQIVYQANATSFTQGIFQINSQQYTANANANVITYGNSQNVTLNVAKVANSTTVNHTAYSTLFSGNAIITAYSVVIANVANTANANVVESNVQIILTQDTANLGANTSVLHTVSYRAS